MKRILISRTDKIGDVVLTLPLAGVLKQEMPGVDVVFLGARYTRQVIESCRHVDRFLDWGELSEGSLDEQVEFLKQEAIDAIVHVFPQRSIARLAKAAGVPIRVGTRRRWYHWVTCNRLVSVSRRHSGLHEAILNLKLLSGLGVERAWSVSEIPRLYGLEARAPLPEPVQQVLGTRSFRLVLHPRSRGSAREWPLEHYASLIDRLDPERFEILITGTPAESADVDKLLSLCKDPSRVHNLCGQLSLPELLRLLSEADGFIGASTGPLHLASALGTRTLGLYPPIRPMDGTRWGPLGQQADFVSSKASGSCEACRSSLSCPCMALLTPEQVLSRIEAWESPVRRG